METGIPLADDTQLRELSQDAPKELFPFLSRANAFSSLIVLLVVFHAVLAFRFSHITNESANRSLAALAFRQSPSMEGILEPNSLNPGLISRFAPPLTGWLTTGFVALFPQFPLLISPLISSIAAGLLFAVFFVLIREFVNSRVAFLSVVLLGFHPSMLHFSQWASVEMLGIVLSLFTFWCYQIHLVHRGGVVSWELMWGGISLGLCLLASGPLAILVAAVIFSYAFAVVIFKACSFNRGRKRAVSSNPWMVIPSFLLLLLTGFAVGGWWELRMAQHFGQPFWDEWLFNPYSVSGEIQLADSLALGTKSFLWNWTLNVIDQLNWLIGLLILGGCSLLIFRSNCKLIFRSNCKERDQFHIKLFLTSWFLVGLSCLGLFFGHQEILVSSSNMLVFFISIPLLVLVAVALDRISSRDVSLRLILLFTVFSLALIVWRQGIETDSLQQRLLPVVSLLVILGALAWNTIIYCDNQEFRTRVVSLFVTGFLFLGYLQNSQESIQAADPDYTTLVKLKQYVGNYEFPIQQVLMLTDQSAPPILECWCMGLRPDAGFQVSQLWQPPVKLNGNTDSSNEFTESELIVAWGTSDFVNRSSQFPDDKLIQIAPPQYFASFELRLFVIGEN